MRTLLIYVPSRKGFGSKVIPLGPMAAANVFMDSGSEVRIFDMLVDGDTEVLMDEIRRYKPDVVGYSGIASSYPKAKEVSRAIRAEFKDIVQLAGGPLSSTYGLMLGNRVADYVVHGEAEASLSKLIGFLRGKESLEKVGGVSYLKGGDIIRTSPEEQIILDTIKLPAYDLVDIGQYIRSLRELRQIYGYSISSNRKLSERFDYFISKGKDNYLEIVASRGCTHACLFCYRHVKGIRRHSVGYVIDHIRFLVDKYDLGGICFSDELFNSDTQWVYDFCDAVEMEFKGELFYKVGGARANKVDRKLLERLWQTMAVDISYGQESGSPRILKEYRKGITVEQNIEATNLSKEVGLFTPVQLVIGSPEETTETVFETMSFLKKVNAYFHSTSINYLIPMPETPIWKYAMENKLIADQEEYLDRVARFGGMYDLGLNLTRSSNFIWKLWLALLTRRTLLNEAKHKKNPLLYVYNFFFGQVIQMYASKRFRVIWGRLSGNKVSPHAK